MPTIVTHAIIPVTVRFGFGKRVINSRLFVLSLLFSILPDADVLSFKLGIPYASQWGHRGFMHSVFFALCMAVLSAFFYRILKSSPAKVFLAILFSSVSHSLLDAMTDGGLGVALLWPFSEERLFFIMQPIKVSPIGIRRFLSERGLAVIKSELLWVWLPFLGSGMAVFLSRKVFVLSRRDNSKNG